jgi:hypothetical protein
MRFRKPKPGQEYFTIIFVRQEENRFHVVKKKTLDEPKPTIRLGKKKSYVIQYDSPTIVHGLNRRYVIDYESGDQYLLGEGTTNPLTPEELDIILGTKIVKEITSSVQKDMMQYIIPALIGALAGFLAAWLIASFTFQEKIDELTRLLFENNIPTPWESMKVAHFLRLGRLQFSQIRNLPVVKVMLNAA